MLSLKDAEIIYPCDENQTNKRIDGGVGLVIGFHLAP